MNMTTLQQGRPENAAERLPVDVRARLEEMRRGEY